MTMYVRTSQPIAFIANDEGQTQFSLGSDVAYKVLPVWVAQQTGFAALWAAGTVQVALDTAFTQLITSIPTTELSVGSLPANIGDIVVRTTPRATPELWSSFPGKANGPAPATFDSGQAAGVVLGPTGSAAQAVVNGLLVAAPTGTGNTASYYTGQLSGVATRIGGRFVFSAKTTITGSITLGICNEAITNSGGVVVPDMSCHMTIAPTGWTYAVWAGPNNANAGVVTIASGGFATNLAVDGVTEYETQVWIAGNTATIDLPDGTRQVVTDSRIGNTNYSGRYVFFEQYANDANTDNTAGFTHVWATSGLAKPSTDTFGGWRKALALSATTTTAIGAGTEVAVPGLTLNFIAPPSGAVVVRAGVFLNIASATDVLLALVLSTTSGSVFPNATIGAALNGNQYVQSDFIVPGLTPNAQYSTAVYVYTSAATSIAINPAAFQNGNLIIEPLY